MSTAFAYLHHTLVVFLSKFCPTVPTPLYFVKKVKSDRPIDLSLLVETAKLEFATPCMSSKYSNQLSYASIVMFIIPATLTFGKQITNKNPCDFSQG